MAAVTQHLGFGVTSNLTYELQGPGRARLPAEHRAASHRRPAPTVSVSLAPAE